MKAAYDVEKLQDEVKKISGIIEAETFQRFYAMKRESTESSPSGRYIGHYKVAASDDDLSWLHVTMLNIALICGFANDWWKYSNNIMIEKDPGLPKLNLLCVVQLFETDFNFVFQTVFGKRMMAFAAKYCQLNKSQYRSRTGKLCQSVILNKVITCDLFRLTKTNGAVAEFDAMANYDQMIPSLAALACRRLGMGTNSCTMMLDTMENMDH